MEYVSIFTIQRTAVEILSARRPSSVTTKYRFRDADISSCQLPPGGSQEEKTISNLQLTYHFIPEAAGRQVGDPYNGYAEPWVHPIQRSTPPEVESRRRYDLPQFVQTGAKNDVAENTTSFCISSPAALAAAAIAAAFFLFGAEQQPCHVSADGSQQRIVPEAHPIHPPI